LSVKNKTLNILISKNELNKRLKKNIIKKIDFKRGYQKLYYQSVLQADKGCDFDFLII
jgi:dihydroxy-acid dehydratase